MKIILVGASGTIGKRVERELSKRHEILKASLHKGPLKIDLSYRESIKEMYTDAGNFDALVCCAGTAYFGPFDSMTEENFYEGIRNKMMGQVNLVMIGKEFINDNGSFTLTTGVTADDPVKNSVGLSLVNGALNSFVKAAALHMKRGIRVNAACTGVVEDAAEKYAPYFPGHSAIPMNRVVAAYLKSVEGIINGEVVKVY